jgi:hypothetical protein
MFGTILFQEFQLTSIQSTMSLLTYQLDSFLVWHAEFHESKSNHDGRTTQTGYTMNSNTSVRILFELLFQQAEPFVSDFRWWRLTIGKSSILLFV